MYKIIKNNVVIDVNNLFLKEHQTKHVLVKTTVEDCNFIISSDGLTLYTTAWCWGVEDSKYKPEKVEAILIDEEEYLQLREQLQLNKTIEYIVQPETQEPQIITPDLTENEKVEVLDAIAMKRKILELEELVQQLLKK